MKFTYSALTAALMLAFGATSVVAAEGDTPPNAVPGECYARVYIAPTVETTYQQVISKAATQTIAVTAPVYGTEEKTVLVREPSTQLEVIPATYKTVTEEIVVKPASTRLEVVPATYTTTSETVVVQEASTQWKRGRAWLGKAIDTKSFTSNDGSIDD